jgi:hypothetical protein
MYRSIAFVLCILVVSVCGAQVFIDDFVVNDFQNNSGGVWRPRIAVASDGSFSVAWQDYSDRPGVNSNTTGRSQIAVQRFSTAGQPLEHIHFFRGESTTTWMWMFDYMEHAELRYLSTGSLLVLMQHSGRFVIGNDDVGSSEVTLGAINADGQIIKLHQFGDNVQYPLIFTSSSRQDRPRLAVTPNDLIIAILDEFSYDSDYRNVAFRALDTSLEELISREVPHDDGVGQAPHMHADAATNGQLFATVWQDGRNGNTWDVAVQFYSPDGPIGTNQKINQTNPGTGHALWPSVAMNSAGRSVAVWIDMRNGVQIYGNIFGADGNPLSGNFRITDTPPGGDIYSRPEVAVRDDGSFMVVWTDSTNAPQSFRAWGRQYLADGTALGEPFLIPSVDAGSGLPDIVTDGASYYVTWLDNRFNQDEANIYAKKMGTILSSAGNYNDELPQAVTLYPAYPNPFNPSTRIGYSIPRQGYVILKVFDLLGREITTLVDEARMSGHHEITFDAGSLPSGLYLYRLEAGGTVLTKKMMLVK